MSEKTSLNIAKDLKGKPVLMSQTGERLGEVSDAIIHPTEGDMVGIEIQSADHKYGLLEMDHFIIGPDAVMAQAKANFDDTEKSNILKRGVRALADIVGSNIVSEDGKLLGRVSEVHILSDGSRTFYYVTESALQRFLGRGFFISGDMPQALSQDHIRMILPTETVEHQAASSVIEVMNRRESTVDSTTE